MATGEGKTLVASLPSYLNALRGNGVHVVTVRRRLTAAVASAAAAAAGDSASLRLAARRAARGAGGLSALWRDGNLEREA